MSTHFYPRISVMTRTLSHCPNTYVQGSLLWHWQITMSSPFCPEDPSDTDSIIKSTHFNCITMLTHYCPRISHETDLITNLDTLMSENRCHDTDRITMSTHFCPRILPSGSTTAYFLGLLHSTWTKTESPTDQFCLYRFHRTSRSRIIRHRFKHDFTRDYLVLGHNRVKVPSMGPILTSE